MSDPSSSSHQSHALPEHALFVYGTLMPGGVAHHRFGGIKLTAMNAVVRARYSADGWGQTGGYPAIILDEHAGEIRGSLILSNDLETIIADIDAYEGHAYQRVRYHATAGDGTVIACQIFELATALHPGEEEPAHLGE